MAAKLILKNRLQKIINSQHFISFLFGMLGAILIALFLHFINSPKIFATVNLTKMVNQFIKEEQERHVSKENLKEDTKRFGVQLEFALKQLSESKNIVLLPKEAVIAGVEDKTDELYQLLNVKGERHVSFE
jgi:hypothetical protein